MIENEIDIPQRDPNVLKANTIFQPQVTPFVSPPSPIITLETILSQLYPRKFKHAKESRMQWCETVHKKRKTRQVQIHANTLSDILRVLADNDPLFASDILSMITKKSAAIQCKMDDARKSDSISEQITASIKDFVNSKLTKATQIQDKEALHTLIQACSFSSHNLNELNKVRVYWSKSGHVL